MDKRRANLVFGFFVMLLSAVFFVLSFQFPEQTLAFSPRIFPRFVSVCLFLVAAVLFGQGVAAQTERPRRQNSTAGADRAFWIRLSAGILLAFGYTRLLPIMGYVVATLPFIGGIMLIFKEKSRIRVATNSIVTTALLYVLFRIVFKVPLPRFDLF